MEVPYFLAVINIKSNLKLRARLFVH